MHTSTHTDHIRRTSLWLVYGSTFGLVAMGLLMLALCARPAWFSTLALNAYPGVTAAQSLPIAHHMGLLGLALAGLGIGAFILWQIRGLFARFAEGDVFSARPPRYIRRIGQGLIAAVLIRFLTTTAAVLVLSSLNEPGARMLRISFAATDAALILFGVMMITLGWVQGEAARLAEENRGFV